MGFSITPQASNTPPRVRLDASVDTPDTTFSSLTIYRDGKALREQPELGSDIAIAFDYEAPFGRQVEYRASGTTTLPAAPDWTESWADLSNWSGDTASYSVAAGEATSSTIEAKIKRSASGVIQSVEVDSPVYIRLELLNSADVVVASVTVEDRIVVTSSAGTRQTAGSGSFTVTLSGTSLQVIGSTWQVSSEFSGTPEKVQIVSRGRAYPLLSTAPVGGSPRGIAVMSTGMILVTDTTNKLVRKFNTSLVEQVGSGFPFSTTGEPRGICVDGSDNIYVIDSTNTRVRKYNASGSATDNWSTTDYPWDIAFNSSTGNVHVARVNGSSGSIRRYTTSGSTVSSSTSAGGIIRGIWVDGSGNTYVVDSTADTVKKYDSSMSLVQTINVGTDVGAVAVDSSGRIFVACRDEYSVRVYSSAGTLLNTIGTTGRPYYVTVDSSDRPWVTEYTGSTLRLYEPTAASVGEITVTPLGDQETFDEVAVLDAGDYNPGEAWLIHPSLPALSVSIDANRWREDGVNVDISSAQSASSGAASTSHYAVGRERPMVVTNGNRLADTWTLVLLVCRLVDRDALRALVNDQTPLLLRSPETFGWDLPDDWYSIGDVTTTRVVQPLGEELRRISLPLQPVDEPIVRRGALYTYDDLSEDYATYADMTATGLTYYELMAGG